MLAKMLTLACSMVVLISGPANAMEVDLPSGYSDDQFQLGDTSSFVELNITALGSRDPTLCNACNSGYTDLFTVSFFNQAGALLEAVNGTNYFYASNFSTSHGIGAGPVEIAVPAGATEFNIVDQLSIFGYLSADNLPLNYGELNIFSNGPMTAVTPIPAALPMFAGGLGILGWLGWRKRRRA